MDVRAWPLPYLIKPVSPILIDVFLDTLAGQRVLHDNIDGIGEIEIRLGGPTWDVHAGRADSVRDTVPSPVTGVVSVSASDLPDYFVHEGLVFVSRRFRAVCEPFIKSGEFLPAAFSTSIPGARSLGEGPKVDNYYWLNTWNRIDLVDLDRSTFATNNRRSGPQLGRPDQISAWTHLALKPNLGADDHLFGVLQIVGEARYASIELRNAVISAGLQVHFEPILLEVGPDFLERSRKYSQQVNGSDLMPATQSA